MSVAVRGLERAISNMAQMSEQQVLRLRRAIEQAGETLHVAVREQAGLTDHSLAELRRMGHPYAKRLAVDSGPHADDLVHKQSGNLYRSIEKETRLWSGGFRVAVGVKASAVPYIRYLLYGTSKMRPRNFLDAAGAKVKDRILRQIQYSVARGGGSRGGVR